MPKFKTTAKDVAAPFAKRTADTVEILGRDVTVFFRKGTKSANEKVTGWYGNIEGVEAHAATLDDAADAAILARIERGDDEPRKDESTETDVSPLTARDVLPAGMFVDSSESEPVKSEPVESAPEKPAKGKGKSVPKMTGAKVSTLVMDAYKRSHGAVTAMLQGKITQDSAQRIIHASMASVTGDIESASKSGVDADKLARFGEYSAKIMRHHSVLCGGVGDKLTHGQRARAKQKLGMIAGQLMAA